MKERTKQKLLNQLITILLIFGTKLIYRYFEIQAVIGILAITMPIYFLIATIKKKLNEITDYLVESGEYLLLNAKAINKTDSRLTDLMINLAKLFPDRISLINTNTSEKIELNDLKPDTSEKIH